MPIWNFNLFFLVTSLPNCFKMKILEASRVQGEFDSAWALNWLASSARKSLVMLPQYMQIFLSFCSIAVYTKNIVNDLLLMQPIIIFSLVWDPDEASEQNTKRNEKHSPPCQSTIEKRTSAIKERERAQAIAALSDHFSKLFLHLRRAVVMSSGVNLMLDYIRLKIVSTSFGWQCMSPTLP